MPQEVTWEEVAASELVTDIEARTLMSYRASCGCEVPIPNKNMPPTQFKRWALQVSSGPCEVCQAELDATMDTLGGLMQ